MLKNKGFIIYKLFTFISFVLISSSSLFAQEQASQNQQEKIAKTTQGDVPELSISPSQKDDIDKLSGATAQLHIQEFPLRYFEDDGFWRPSMARDDGIMTLQLLRSQGSSSKILQPENAPNNHILGAKIIFTRRSMASAYILPATPIPVEGVAKIISVWVAGRNTGHTLKLLIHDRFGNKSVVFMGKLNFTGWKKLTGTISPSLKQHDYHSPSSGTGILIDGFRIDMDLKDAYGTFYVYFDDLAAKTDLFVEEGRDKDDPIDNW